MATMQTSLSALADWLVRANWQAAILAALVLLATWLLRRWLTASARYALLLLVAARLIMPMLPHSSLSIFNLLQRSPTPSPLQIKSDLPSVGDWVITKEPLSHAITPLPAMPAVSATPILTWRLILAIFWLAGVVFIAIRIIRANLKLYRRLRRATVVDDPHILDLLAACKSKMNVGRALPILETDAIHSPALMGLFRPQLLLPLNLRDRLTDAEMRFVFLHELAHLKRCDIAIDWCLAILQTLHWFNPLIASAFARARAERELARDAMVLAAATPGEQTSYGQTIVKLVESFARLGPRPGTIGILEGNGGKTQLKRRIIMIANFQRPMRGGTVLAGLLGGVLAVALLTDCKATADETATGSDSAKAGDPATRSDSGGIPPQPAPRASATANDGAAARGREVNARDAAAQAILDHRIPELKFNAVALIDAIEFLRDSTGANISVDWKAMEAAGIAKTAPVTTRMRDIKFSTALKTILNDVGRGNVKLSFEINDGVIVISTAEQIEKNTVVEVYDIRDLVMMNKDEKLKEESVKQVMKVIEDTIDRNTWEGNGGHTGSIKHLNGQLVVTQTKANQKQVGALLEKLSETRAIQVSVQAHLMSVPPAILKDLGIDIQKDPDAIRIDGVGFNVKGAVVADKGAGKPGKSFQGASLDDDQVGKLIRAVQASAGATTITAPRLRLFNGQQGTIAIGEEIPYISGWTEPKGGKRDPQISYVKTGFMLTLQATVSADRKYCTLHMQPRIAKLRKLDEGVWPQVPAGENLNIQKPDLAVQELDEIVSVPDNGTLLTVLGESQEAKDPKGTVNVLLVRPTIVIQREIEEKQFPPLEFPLENRPKQ